MLLLFAGLKYSAMTFKWNQITPNSDGFICPLLSLVTQKTKKWILIIIIANNDSLLVITRNVKHMSFWVNNSTFWVNDNICILYTLYGVKLVTFCLIHLLALYSKQQFQYLVHQSSGKEAGHGERETQNTLSLFNLVINGRCRIWRHVQTNKKEAI